MASDISIITMVGAVRYDMTTYKFTDKKVSSETTIFSNALIEHYKDELKEVVFLGTETSSWSAILPEPESEEDKELYARLKANEAIRPNRPSISREDFEGVRKRLKEYYPFDVHVLPPQKSNINLEENPLAVYSKIINYVKNTKIVFDITSAFRYMPLFIFESLQTYSPDFDVNDITLLYAEKNEDGKDYEVRDISEVWRAAEINKALYTFKTTLDGIKLSVYLKKINYDISNWIERFSKNIQKSYMALCDCDFFEELSNYISSMNDEDLHKPYLEETIKFLSEKILPEFYYLKDISKEERRSWCLFSLSGILEDFGLHSQALIALRESGQMRIIEAKKPELLHKAKIKPKDLTPYEDELKEEIFGKLHVTKLWYQLKDVRNYGAHAGIELIYHEEKSENFSKYQKMIKKVLENVPCEEKNVTGS